MDQDEACFEPLKGLVERLLDLRDSRDPRARANMRDVSRFVFADVLVVLGERHLDAGDFFEGIATKIEEIGADRFSESELASVDRMFGHAVDYLRRHDRAAMAPADCLRADRAWPELGALLRHRFAEVARDIGRTASELKAAGVGKGPMESSESLTETGRLKILAEQRMLKDLAETWRPALEFIGRLRAEIKHWSG